MLNLEAKVCVRLRVVSKPRYQPKINRAFINGGEPE